MINNYNPVTMGGVLPPYWDSALIHKDVSGSIVSFSDGADGLPLKSLFVDNEATKLTRCGANLYPNANGVIPKYGYAYFYGATLENSLEKESFFILPAGNYSVKADKPSGTEKSRIQWRVWQLDGVEIKTSGGDFTGEAVADNGVKSNIIYQSYRYTPIDYYDFVEYHFTLLVPAGLLIVNPNDDAYGPLENAMLVYGDEVADYQPYTAETYNLSNGVPSRPVTTILGENNFFADTGDISLIYYADATLAHEAQTAELQALILEQ